MNASTRFLIILLVVSFLQDSLPAATPTPIGYDFLLNTPYLPPDFDQDTFDQVWKVWPEPLRTKAQKASPVTRRQMAFDRYGLTLRPGDSSGKPLQYVVSDQGEWTMNCFACHGGSVNGESTPGAPNSNFELATLTAEIRLTKLQRGKRLTRMDVGSLVMPLGTSTGTTNAVMFGVALMAYRNPDLSFSQRRLPPPMVHHDMDAPPWWHFYRKERLYIDGFAPSGPRPLMQFMLVEENGQERFKEWESDFEQVFAYMKTLRPPVYPKPINHELASVGQTAFERVCSDCHGSYGSNAYYPERIVAIDEIGTDRVRHEALKPHHRVAYAKSWFGHYGEEDVTSKPIGYVAPPLDGIWASAPYLHNGSVPTLWHLLHPQHRPSIWKRNGKALDFYRLGLAVDEFSEIPTASSKIQKRRYFDTRRFGKSAAGHDFVNQLSADEKLAVLEYLKTL